MVVERWAVIPPEDELDDCATCDSLAHNALYPCPGCHQRVRVLEDEDFDLVRRAASVLQEAGEAHLSEDLRALLPAPPEPPTYEEAHDLVRRVVDIVGDRPAGPDLNIIEECRNFLARAEAARKGEP